MTRRARRLPRELELTDGVVTLRRWSPGDVDALSEIWQDRELQRRFGVEPPVTHEAITAYVAGVDRRWRDRVQVSLAIVAGGRLVGGCDLDHLDAVHPDLGYWVMADERGKGYATRASALVLDWASVELALVDVHLETEPDNTASIAVAERLGFARAEGIEHTDGSRHLEVYVLTISR